MDSRDRTEISKFLEHSAMSFRDIAFEIESDPLAIHRHVDNPGVQSLATMFVPQEFGAKPFKGPSGKSYYFMTSEERVLSLEKLAYGDAGVLLASPGPSLSGYIINDLGSPEQKQTFYGSLLSEPTWTFFALTEPKRGSDAMNIETKLTKGQPGEWTLSGEKYFVGNASRAQLGVTFARYAPGPLGIEIVFIDTSKPGYSAHELPTLGMRGAGISQIKFDQYAVDDSAIVGKAFRPSHRGLWGAIKTFNRMRPGVAAIALGISQATYDYIIEGRKQLKPTEQLTLEQVSTELKQTRAIIEKAARSADDDASNGYWGSIAKYRSVKLAERVTDLAPRFFGPAAFIQHPFLEKWYRDARGCEYMEGTHHIQKLNIFQGYLSGKGQ